MFAGIKRETAAVAFIVMALFAILYLYMVPSAEGFVDRIRCGVDLPACTDGLRCINGYCKTDVPAQMPTLSDLPIRP
jgi:hypothetical protein